MDKQNKDDKLGYREQNGGDHRGSGWNARVECAGGPGGRRAPGRGALAHADVSYAAPQKLTVLGTDVTAVEEEPQ